MFDELIEKDKNNIINDVMTLINIPSISDENNFSKESPFGKNCNLALKEFLDIGNKLGFKTKNIDNYCGYVEFGEGEELVGIIGHLDVVPADISDGWTSSPFEATIRDNKIFGRGSIDDKGPVIAALYAMNAIKNSCKVSKRIRLIVGLNEEKSWKCINYYKEHEEWPTIGFSPDANFPGIYAEKGILSLKVEKEFNSPLFEFINITTNNNAINVVPKYIKTTIKLLSNIDLPIKNNMKINKLDDKIYELEFFGKASHAAHPELGDNAIKKMITYFSKELDVDYFKYLLEINFFDIESPKFMNDSISDESGLLTSNIANCEYINSILSFKINLRIPVTYSLDEIIQKYNILKEFDPNINILEIGKQEPLYIKQDNYLVKTLVNIFNNKTNLNEKPIAIGGGTYARAFENCISYGLNFPGDEDLCHQVNEYVDIDKLILGSKIYAEAIYELSK